MITEDIRAFGEWWIPENPDRRLAGELTANKEKGILLRTIGAFNDTARNSDADRHQLILGNTQPDGKFTLYGCWQSSRDQVEHFPGPQAPAVISYRADLILCNQLFESVEETRFLNVSTDFTYLDQWADCRPFEWSTPEDSTGADLRAVQVTYRGCDIPSISIGDATLKIWCGSRQHHGQFEASISSHSSVILTCDEARPLSFWLSNIVRPLRDFLTFATNQPNATLNLETDIEIRVGNRALPRTVRIVTSWGEVPEGDDHPMDMLFNYDAVKDRFQEVVESWFALYVQAGYVIHLLLGSFYFRGEYPVPTLEFLTLVQAAEAFHRIFRDGKAKPEEEHQKFLEKIYGLPGMTGKQRKWLKGKLKFSNEKSLSTRLSELLEETAPTTRPLVADRDKFAERVAGARNFYSHQEPSLQKHEPSVMELIDMIDTLIVMMQAVLLQQIGFTQGETFDRLRMTYRYRNIGQKSIVSWPLD